jgi:hypothetical protein
VCVATSTLGKQGVWCFVPRTSVRTKGMQSMIHVAGAAIVIKTVHAAIWLLPNERILVISAASTKHGSKNQR